MEYKEYLPRAMLKKNEPYIKNNKMLVKNPGLIIVSSDVQFIVNCQSSFDYL